MESIDFKSSFYHKREDRRRAFSVTQNKLAKNESNVPKKSLNTYNAVDSMDKVVGENSYLPLSNLVA